MDTIIGMVRGLFEVAGQNWAIAVAAAFVAMMCEAAYPDREDKVQRGPLGIMAVAASLITPFLLFVHAFWSVAAIGASRGDELSDFILRATQNTIVAGIFIVMIPLTLGPSIPGWVIRKASPSLGRALFAASPFLHVAVFAFTVFVTRHSVIGIVNLMLHRTP